MYISKILLTSLTKPVNKLTLSKMGTSFTIASGVVHLYDGLNAVGKLVSFDATGSSTLVALRGELIGVAATLALVSGQKVVLRRKLGGYDVVYNSAAV